MLKLDPLCFDVKVEFGTGFAVWVAVGLVVAVGVCAEIIVVAFEL